MNNSLLALLKETLKNEYAIVYAYGVIAARMSSPYQDIAIQALINHREIRDTINDHLLTTSTKIPVPDIAYTVPYIDDLKSGAKVAQSAEHQSCFLYRKLIADSCSTDVKQQALDWMTTSSNTLIRWNTILTGELHIEAFPGIST